MVFRKQASSKEEAEILISEVSGSAAQSIDMGYPMPVEHGGTLIRASNGYIAITSGNVIYGFIGTYALLGFPREGSLSAALEVADGWEKTTIYNWVVGLAETVNSLGEITIAGQFLDWRNPLRPDYID